MDSHSNGIWNARRAAAAAALGVLLAGCTEGGGEGFNLDFLKPRAKSESGDAGAETSVTFVERDVEAPEVFQVTDSGLWDGRPSLGGVWVAHPDVKEPERVIIRNLKNSKFVIGALFRRERENPGPVLQVSSDAAEALGMLAGAPAELNVTALRREQTEAAPEPATDTETAALEAPDDVETAALDPALSDAAAAIAEAEAVSPQPQPQPQPQATEAAARASSLEKPYIQIGIFSVEQNASNTATSMRQNGIVPIVRKQTSQGKTFWRVIVGPAQSQSERSALLKKIKGVGFDDAYPVTN